MKDSHSNSVLIRRRSKKNRNHHLWKNNDIWYIYYTLACEVGNSLRVRTSLETRCVREARIKRALIFEQLQKTN